MSALAQVRRFSSRAARSAVPARRSAAPGVLWRFATGGRAITTAPAVGRDGTLYAASNDGALYAVAPDGRRRWSLRTGIITGAVPPTKPAIAPDGTTYWNVGGSVVAVTPAGQRQWVFLAAGGGSPLLSRGRVLFASGTYLYAVATTGSQAGHAVWRAAIGASGGATGAPTPAVGPDGTAYVPASDGVLYAIAADGLRRWTFTAGASLFSPAVGLDGTVYLDAFANGRGTLYALTPAGKLRWRLSVPSGNDLVCGPDDTIYVARHLLVAVSPRGRVLWRRAVDATAPPTVASDGSIVVPTLSSSSLLALDRGGALRWRVTLPASPVGSPAAGPGGRLYSGDYSGMLTALAPGVRGTGHLIHGAAPPGSAVDLGADNPPFVVSGGRTIWRVTVQRTVERSDDGGRRWREVLSPGASTPDQRTGLYHNARYADVAFLAVDPHDPRGLYVGALGALGDYLSGGAGGADGGLYVSVDGATGWRRVDSGLPYTYEPRLRAPTYGLDSLVFDPARRGVLYAQTPVAYGSPGHDAGLYKSDDGGVHWREATRGLAAVTQRNGLIGAYRAYPPGTLLVDRARTSVLFLVTPTGFYRSADAAAHWSRVTGIRYGDPDSVAVRIGTGDAVRAFTDRGVYVSVDYGAHWHASSAR